jgi:hypothetical protein
LISSNRWVDIRNALLKSAMAVSLGFKGLRYTCAPDQGSESSTGIPFRIETCQQFTLFEGIQQVHLRAGRVAAGGGRNRLKKTDSTLPPGIMYRRVYG